jgi:Ser/Thr protein kinase RdoA (MazF antagonist)
VTSLPHGYTNATMFAGGRVVKRYLGRDAAERMWNEVDAIRRSAGRVPAPSVLAVDEISFTVTLARMPGRPGQELIAEGFADRVLEAAGRTLRALHAGPEAPAWAHGDYGPQNLLFDGATLEVTGVLDWEFARPGGPVTDLAWAEWIVRMHHPGAVPSLAGLFQGWGDEPAWDARRAPMLEACGRFLARARDMGDHRAAELWSRRADVTASWAP